jgi:hypothetical protein
MLVEQHSQGQASMLVLVCVLGLCVRGYPTLPQGGIETQTRRVHQHLPEGAQA